MAQTAQEESSESGRDFRQAGREAESATRRLQAGTAEFLSGMMSRPYVDLLRETEVMRRQWTEGVRTSVEQTLNIASKMNEMSINELRRVADFVFRIYETGESLQESMVHEAESVTNRQARSARSQAAE